MKFFFKISIGILSVLFLVLSITVFHRPYFIYHLIVWDKDAMNVEYLGRYPKEIASYPILPYKPMSTNKLPGDIASFENNKTWIYTYNDDYIFFTTMESIHNNFNNEIYAYTIKTKIIENISKDIEIKLKEIGLPTNLLLRFDVGTPIFKDTIYFSVYPNRIPERHFYVLSYNFKTHQLKKFIKLPQPTYELTLHQDYLYFDNNDERCGGIIVFDCSNVYYRKKLN